jgi:hypothetical protein
VNRDPDDRAQPEGGPAPDEFDAIVAGWRREGEVPQWPDAPASHDLFQPATPGAGERPGEQVPDDEHFVPPEPPPLPRLGPPAIVGLVLLGLGLVLLVAPGWIGVPDAYGLPLGLLGLAAGLGWLVLRLWPDQPTGDDDSDDGAIV